MRKQRFHLSGIAFIGALMASVLSIGLVIGTPAKASCMSKVTGCNLADKISLRPLL